MQYKIEHAFAYIKYTLLQTTFVVIIYLFILFFTHATHDIKSNLCIYSFSVGELVFCTWTILCT